LNESGPVLSEDSLRVHLFFLHDFGKILLKERVHFDYRSELDLDFRLLFSDVLESQHDVSKAVDVLSRLLNFKFCLLDIVVQCLQHGLGFLVKILGVGVLPHVNPLNEA